MFGDAQWTNKDRLPDELLKLTTPDHSPPICSAPALAPPIVSALEPERAVVEAGR